MQYTPFRNALTGICLFSISILHAQQSAWDSIKPTIAPLLTAEYEHVYYTPAPLPLGDYGWEDGLQVSFDGLHLYALYAPADLLSWVGYFVANPGLPICETLGSGDFIRPYANDYGIDMHTNLFGCDTFMNLDILHAERTSLDEPFDSWTLSGIARPGAIEGGPYPVFDTGDPSEVDHFLFTGPGDIWMINNTIPHLDGIASAIRLPSPINPVTNEFTADNPMMRRLGGDSLLLVYEKYTDPGLRDFMFSISDDDGLSWSSPQVITSINNDAGHIEHPMVYFDGSDMWLYYSRNFDIYAAIQSIAGDWDSWVDERPIILKGNATGIGEPSLSANGDLYFVTVMINPDNPADAVDADPWYAKIQVPNSVIEHHTTELTIYPNPAGNDCLISLPDAQETRITVISINGTRMDETCIRQQSTIDLLDYPSGIYEVIASRNNEIIATARLIKL